MSALTCPRCRSEVQVAEGGAPVCPACGLGARDAAETPVRSPAATPADGPVPRASSGRWKVPAAIAAAVLVVAAAVVALFAAGVGPEALSQEEAEEAAALAMTGLVEDMQSRDGGDLSRLEGTLSFDAGEFGGAGTATFEMEWGRSDAGHFVMGIDSGVFQAQLEGYCFPDRTVLILGSEVYEGRPQAEGSCMDLMTGDAPADGLSVLEFTRGDLPDMQVTPHGDGTVTATFSDDEGNYTLHVDARGRATQLEVDGGGASGTFDASYGARRTLTAPEPTGRIPSSVDGDCFLAGGSCTYTARQGGDAPLSDFEVRVYADGATPDDDPSAQPVASFPLDGGDQSADGFSLSVTEDGDGLFGSGDRFHLTAPGDDYEVVVWDVWADRDVRDNPMPVSPLWAALALAGAALLRRR